MKERPILFSAPMVRALLAGTKTQTRRLVKSRHVDDAAIWSRTPDAQGRWESGLATGAPGSFGHGEYVRCPYGGNGGTLWVRETWQGWKQTSYEHDEWEALTRAVRGCDWVTWTSWNGRPEKIEYRATSKSVGPWTPAIHMPRWASRITLEVTAVRVERLQAIAEEDARAEGVEPLVTTRKVYPSKLAADIEERSYRGGFARLWDEITGKRAAWASNPWVFVVEFRRVV